ncbi:hypothetical protein, partial [Streptococcus agalactiae]
VIISRPIVITIVKEKTSWINIPVCLQSEKSKPCLLFYIDFTNLYQIHVLHVPRVLNHPLQALL